MRPHCRRSDADLSLRWDRVGCIDVVITAGVSLAVGSSEAGEAHGRVDPLVAVRLMWSLSRRLRFQ